LRFTFTVPSGYSLQNSQSAVVAVAGDGEAVRFDSAKVPQSMSLENYLRSGWIAGLKSDTVRAQQHNGIEMAVGEAKTEKWAFHVAVARFDQEVYRFIFAAKSNSKRFAKAADDTLRSFRRASDKDIGQIEKTSIRLVVARPGDTTSSLAAKMKKVSNGRELFLVLNNLYAGDPIQPGRQYKIVTIER
jgi:predicted Zn-dependent protease